MDIVKINLVNISTMKPQLKDILDEMSKSGKEYDVELFYEREPNHSENCVLIIKGEYPIYADLLLNFFKDMKAIEKFDFKTIELHIVKSVGIMLLEKSND